MASSSNLEIGLLQKRIAELMRSEQAPIDTSDTEERRRTTHGGDKANPMDLTEYRLSQAEKRDDEAADRMARIEDKLTQIQLAIAGLATKDAVRNWALGIMAIVVACVVGVGALVLQSSSNQLASFQAGLSSVQTAVAVHTAPPPVDTPKQ